MMNRKHILIVLLVQAIAIGCAKKEEVDHYPNGVVKSQIEIVDGKPHGIYKYFYKSGKLAIQGKNSNGEKNGLEQVYYENGILKQSCEWKGNMRNGYLKKYNENGILSLIAFYKNDKKVGREDWYHSNGKVTTRQIFDSLGNVIYVLNWDSLGQKTYSRAMPIIKIKNDSINVNEECLISVSFGFPLTGKIGFDLESLEAKEAPQIQMERDSIKNIFLFRLKFRQPGMQRFLIMPRHIPSADDTISIDGQGDEVRVFVKKSTEV